jgi:hypothetical protein
MVSRKDIEKKIFKRSFRMLWIIAKAHVFIFFIYINSGFSVKGFHFASWNKKSKKIEFTLSDMKMN